MMLQKVATRRKKLSRTMIQQHVRHWTRCEKSLTVLPIYQFAVVWHVAETQDPPDCLWSRPSTSWICTCSCRTCPWTRAFRHMGSIPSEQVLLLRDFHRTGFCQLEMPSFAWTWRLCEAETIALQDSNNNFQHDKLHVLLIEGAFFVPLSVALVFGMRQCIPFCTAKLGCRTT